MEMYVVRTRPYKANFLKIFTATSLLVAGLAIALRKNLYVLPITDTVRYAAYGLFACMTVFFGLNIKRADARMSKLDQVIDFDERLRAHLEIYRFRSIGHFIAGFVLCICGILTDREIFLHISIINTLATIPLYPFPFQFKSELKRDDIKLR